MKRLSLEVKKCIAIIVLVSVFTVTMGQSAQAATAPTLLMQLSQLQLLLQSLLSQVSPVVKGATTIVVTNDAELVTAIKGVKGGEVIQLAPGTYSKILLVGGTYNQIVLGATKVVKAVPVLTAPVTITSQDSARPAVIPGIDVRSTDHWHFVGLAIRPVKAAAALPAAAVSLSGNDNTFEDSTLTYGDATNWSAADWVAKAGNGVAVNGLNAVVKNNYLMNVYMGIESGKNATGTVIKNNTVNGIGGDGMRVLGNNMIVDSNFLKNFKKINDNHDDCSQSWGIASGTVSQDASVEGVTFQNNICLNNENPADPLYDMGLQGFDSFDGGTKGWLVQNNVFAGTAYHGLVYSGAVNMTIRNNTILDSDSAVNGADNVWIRVFGNKTGTIQPTGNTFQNNISNKFTGYGSSSVVVNSKVVKMADYDKYFRDWRHGDMRLLATSPIQGAGANLDPATVGSSVMIVALVIPVVVPIVVPVATTTVEATTTPTAATTTTSDVTPADAPVVTLSLSAASIMVGSGVTITWSTENASTCIAKGGWGGKKALTGIQTMHAYTATGTQNFILSCTGEGGSVSGRARLTIEADPSLVPVLSTSTDTVATSTATTTVPINKQAEIARLLQLLATLQKMLLSLLAHKH